MLSHLIVNEGCHVSIKWIHQLLGPLYDGNIYAQFPEIFCKFQSYKAAACQYRGLGVRAVYVLLDAESIFHSAQGKNLIQANTGNFRLGRFRTGGEEKLVIRLFKFKSGYQIPDGHGFSVRVDCSYFMVHVHRNTKPIPKALRSL